MLKMARLLPFVDNGGEADIVKLKYLISAIAINSLLQPSPSFRVWSASLEERLWKPMTDYSGLFQVGDHYNLCCRQSTCQNSLVIIGSEY